MSGSPVESPGSSGIGKMKVSPGGGLDRGTAFGAFGEFGFERPGSKEGSRRGSIGCCFFVNKLARFEKNGFGIFERECWKAILTTKVYNTVKPLHGPRLLWSMRMPG